MKVTRFRVIKDIDKKEKNGKEGCMQKSEFLERIGKGKHISDAEYKVIETVYQWHPSIGNTSGKEDVAALYKGFGMAILYDMLPRAEKARELTNQLCHAQAEAERIKEEIKELAYGNALERVQVTPEALEEQLKRCKRQRQNDREAIALAQKAPETF